MTDTLTLEDLRDMIAASIAAIELDQQRANALPSDSVHPQYDHEMWRHWRDAWIRYFERLLETVDAPNIPPVGTSDRRLLHGGISDVLLKGLTRLAANYDPDAVARHFNDQALHAVRECACDKDPFPCWFENRLASSDEFFNALISEVFCAHDPDRTITDIDQIKAAARKWFPPMQDPLHISLECQCGMLTGCVN